MQTTNNTNLKMQFYNAFASRPRPVASQILRSNVSLYEGDTLRNLLESKSSIEFTDNELRTIVEGNLWMLTPQALLYFMPAFLYASLKSYESVSVFASELIGILTKPERSDVTEALDQVVNSPSELGLPEDMTELLRKHQLEWFDSGSPTAIFHECFDDLTDAEGVAILAFLVAFKEAYGEDFPFNELETAIDRHWARYRT